MLLDILKELSDEAQGDYKIPLQKALLISRINKAAKEIYDAATLPGALHEVILEIEVGQSQITFPWYIGDIVGMRWYQGRCPVPLNNIRTRYQGWGYDIVWQENFREKAETPLQRDIENESQLVISTPLAMTEAVDITIGGATDNSQHVVETITLVAGELSKATVNNFKESVRSVTKSIATTYDLKIHDVNDNLMAILPNVLQSVSHKVIQVLDTENRSIGTNSGLEVLFKHTFLPLWHDGDSFLGTDDFDQAIVWKFLEHRARDITSAGVLQAKCNQVVAQKIAAYELGQQRKVVHKPNSFLRLPYGSKW